VSGAGMGGWENLRRALASVKSVHNEAAEMNRQ